MGVVSRGVLCGEPNNAGIYTRVKKALKWIFHYASDGDCSFQKARSMSKGQRSIVSVFEKKFTTTTTTASTTTSSTSTTTDPDLVYP